MKMRIFLLGVMLGGTPGVHADNSVLTKYAAFSLGIGAHFVLPVLGEAVAQILGPISLDKERLSKLVLVYTQELYALDRQLSREKKKAVHAALEQYADVVALTYKLSPPRSYAHTLEPTIESLFPNKKAAARKIIRFFMEEVAKIATKNKKLIEGTITFALKGGLKSLVRETAGERAYEYLEHGLTIGGGVKDLFIPALSLTELNSHFLRTHVGGSRLYCGPKDPLCLHGALGKSWGEVGNEIASTLMVTGAGMIAVPITHLSLASGTIMYTGMHNVYQLFLTIGTSLFGQVITTQKSLGTGPVAQSVVSTIVERLIKGATGTLFIQIAQSTLISALHEAGVSLTTQDLVRRSWSWWSELVYASLTGNVAIVTHLIASESPHYYKQTV